MNIPQSLNEWWSRLTGKPAPSLDASVDQAVGDERVRREQAKPVRVTEKKRAAAAA